MAAPEAKLLAGDHDVVNVPSPKAAPTSGEILVLPGNVIGVVTGLNLSSIAIGDKVTVVVSGPVRLPMASAKVAAAGSLIYWDVSGNTVLPTADAGLDLAADFVAGLVVDGGANGETFVDVLLNNTGVSVPSVSAHTADVTLVASQLNGSIFTTVGASGAVTFSLPAAVAGMEAKFRVGAAQELRIDPNGTETIALPSSGVQGAAGKYLTANAAGETVYIVCDTAGQWSVYGFTGTWTAEA